MDMYEFALAIMYDDYAHEDEDQLLPEFDNDGEADDFYNTLHGDGATIYNSNGVVISAYFTSFNESYYEFWTDKYTMYWYTGANLLNIYNGKVSIDTYSNPIFSANIEFNLSKVCAYNPKNPLKILHSSKDIVNGFIERMLGLKVFL